MMTDDWYTLQGGSGQIHVQVAYKSTEKVSLLSLTLCSSSKGK